jgi:hypothetical protein
MIAARVARNAMAADPISLRPIINDLIHTDARSNGVTLLVDRISILRPTRSPLASGEQAFRLWLSDGSKVIQGKWQAILAFRGLSCREHVLILCSCSQA